MFLRTDFKEGDPLHKVCNAQNLVRMANILEGLQVVGGHLERNYAAEGLGWLLVIDGASDGAAPADSAGIVTSDRLFAVDSLSQPRLGVRNFTGGDSTGYSAGNDLHVRHDVCADSSFSGVAYRQLRLYVKAKDTATDLAKVLGKTAGGVTNWRPAGMVKVDSADTMAYLASQFADTAAYDSTSHALVKAVKTAGKTMRLFLPVAASGTPAYILGKTSGGGLCWVEVTASCDS